MNWIDSLMSEVEIEEEFDFSPLFDDDSFPYLMEDKWIVALVTGYSDDASKKKYPDLKGTVVHLNARKDDVSDQQKKLQEIGYESKSLSNPKSEVRRNWGGGRGWWSMIENMEKFSEEERNLIEELTLDFIETNFEW